MKGIYLVTDRKACHGKPLESIVLDAVKAQDLDVDYLGVSPVFSTPTKIDTKTPWGLGGLEKIRDYSRHPLVAIGGLDAPNTKEVIKAGADAIAVVSAICSADHAFDTTRELVSLFKQIYIPQERRS